MEILITRHGQTDRNLENRVLGRTDMPLNETGLAQAKDLGEKLKDVKLDAIYVSPMIRARQTAQAVAQYHDCPVYTEDALIEQNFGIFEGADRDDPVYQAEKHQYFQPFENGESFLDVAARVYPFLEQLRQKYQDQPDARILLVSHGGICRMIHNFFEGMNNEDFAGYFMKNCALESFEVPEKDNRATETIPYRS